MRHVPYLTRRQLALLPALAAMLLCGCGGGGGGGGDGDGGNSASSPAPTSPASPPAPSPPSSSTALKDNTPSISASFSNFASGQVSVPVEGVAFVGARRFVKIARADGATLFLGEVAPGLPFTVQVDAPSGQRSFSYEIFSESASDSIVHGEVYL